MVYWFIHDFFVRQMFSVLPYGFLNPWLGFVRPQPNERGDKEREEENPDDAGQNFLVRSFLPRGDILARGERKFSFVRRAAILNIPSYFVVITRRQHSQPFHFPLDFSQHLVRLLRPGHEQLLQRRLGSLLRRI